MKIVRARTASSTRRLPLVTVVVPCFNYGHFLPQCVESIVSQPDVQIEILVIDDASTDNSALVASELADRILQVTFVPHAMNLGHIATYNEGLSTADSDYVVLLSADDLLAPGALGRASGLMREHPSVGMTYGHPQRFFDFPSIAGPRRSTWSVWKGRDWIGAQFTRGMSIVYSPEAVVRTAVHHEAGYYRADLPHSGDLEMWLRIAAISDIGRVNGPDQAFRREHAASMMHTHYATVLEDLKRRDDAYESFLTTAGAGLANVHMLRLTVRRRLCHEAIEWVCAALASGTTVERDLADAIAFARRIYPQYASLRVWRELGSLQSHARQSLVDTVVGRYDGAVRDLTNRIRWRRWRYLGI